MLTPLDIQNKEFKRSLRGYDIKAVEAFLDEVMFDYENVYKQNVELKDKVNLFSDQIRYYKTLEETLKETLIIAQTTSEEVISAARLKSKNITDEAELNGDKIIARADEKVREVKQEYEYLKKEMFSFKTRYQTFIEAQLLSLEKFHKEIEVKTFKEIDESSNRLEENLQVDLNKESEVEV